MSLLPTINARGVVGSRPAAAAANEGYNYFGTDTGILYRSNGSSWDTNSAGFTNPMTTAGDIIYGGASGLPTRLAGGTSTYVLTSNGATSAPSWQAGAAGSGATATMNQLGADVTMTNANQFYDGPSLALAIGTYILLASLCIEGIGGTIAQATAKLWDGATVIASGELMTYGGGAWDNNQIALIGLVVIASGTPTWKISVAGLSAGGGKIKAAASDNGAGNNGSTLIAIKIA